MIEAELRIGNLVYDEDGTVLPIISINGNGRVFHTADLFSELTEIRGIPLDQQWLDELGFRYNQLYYFIEINNYHFDFVIITAKKLFGVFIDLDEGSQTWIKNIEYVHQLQNIFYALTDKELNP